MAHTDAPSGNPLDDLDLLGSQAGRLRENDNSRSIEVGQHVDRQPGRQVAAVKQDGQTEDDDEQSIFQGEADDGVEHGLLLPGSGQSGVRSQESGIRSQQEEDSER